MQFPLYQSHAWLVSILLKERVLKCLLLNKIKLAYCGLDVLVRFWSDITFGYGRSLQFSHLCTFFGRKVLKIKITHSPKQGKIF